MSTHDKAKALAAQVASEAIRSGDAESIADAQVGLAALGVEGEIARRLAHASALRTPNAALAQAAGDSSFVELLQAVWQRGEFAAVVYGLRLLGLGASEADAKSVVTAIDSINGKRRSELISLGDVIAILADGSGRRPADDRGWKKKTTTRSVCTFDALTLELGVERVESYALADRSSTALSLTFTAVEVPKRSSEPVQRDVSAPLARILRGPPDKDRLSQALQVLHELGDDPAGIATLERFVSLWPDDQRIMTWGPQSTLPPAGRLLMRGLISQIADVGAGWEHLTALHLYFLSATTDPHVLEKFTSLRQLGIGVGISRDHVGYRAATTIRFPRSLEHLVLMQAHLSPSAWNEEGLATLVPRLLEDCPQLKRIDVEPRKIHALSALKNVELGIFRVTRSGEGTFLGTQLGELGVAVLSLYAFPGIETEIAPYSDRVRELDVYGRPGSLETLLRGAKWPKLRRLAMDLGPKSARMMRMQAPHYTFTRGDLDALAEIIPQLESLELQGIVAADHPLFSVLAKTKLTRLVLNAGEIGNAALEQLASGPLFTTVRALELHRCKLKANAFTVLTSATSLEHLVLTKNAVTQPALERFVAWPGLAALRRLDLREVTLSAPQRAALEGSHFLRAEALDITDSSFW